MDEYWANNFLIWKLKAEELVAAAVILANNREIERKKFLKERKMTNSVDTFLPELMMWAYSIECLLKAVYLKTGGKLIQEKKLIPKWGSHNLVQFAHDVGIKLSDDETGILKELTIVATSIGRYPIAKKIEETPMEVNWLDNKMPVMINIIKMLSEAID